MRPLPTLVVIVVLLALAGPAAAQTRDPFIPLIVPAETGEAVPAGTETATQPGPGTEVTPAREGLPVTGRGIAEWLALAYVLIAAGGAAALFGRSFRTTRLTR